MDALSLKWILKAEGGYVNHPLDPGGETNLGITIGTFNRAKKDGLDLPVSIQDLKPAHAAAIYDKYYYRTCEADKIHDPGLALIHFDTAVNCGNGGAAKQLQRAYNALGGRQVRIQTTLADELIDLINNADSGQLQRAYLTERLRFYRSLKTFKTFGRGWTNRLKNIAAHIGLNWKPV